MKFIGMKQTVASVWEWCHIYSQSGIKFKLDKPEIISRDSFLLWMDIFSGFLNWLHFPLQPVFKDLILSTLCLLFVPEEEELYLLETLVAVFFFFFFFFYFV